MQIEARNLGRRFGRKVALQDVNFTTEPGEIICLIGNNGAGKTTLLQLLGGLLVPTSGEVFLDGCALDRRDESQRQRMAIVPDFPAFLAYHTVLRHLAMVCALYRADVPDLEERAMCLMEEVGISELGMTQLGELSRGEIYKTVLVSLLLVRPKFWLLDEPMASGMDPQGLNFLRHHLKAASDQGATIFYSTQIADVAERFASRVFVLHDGKLLAKESPEELISRSRASSLNEALSAVTNSPDVLLR